ncbi:MAG: TonB-dependent receptor plug domain-containing protein [Gammaproteobacteria bacterium]
MSASCAWAQNGDVPDDIDFTHMSLEELMSLEVYSAASLLPTERAKAPGTVYSFSREDFLRLGVRRLDDLLAYVPGFQLSQHRKRHRSIWARGQIDRFNDKLVLLVDGIRRQHVYYGNFSLGDNFPLEKIEKIEIILGPASTLYGTNAFGGIISVTTRSLSDKSHIEVTAEGGDNERGKGTLLYNSPQFQAFGSYLNQDAPFRDDRKSFIGGETLQPLDEDYANLFFKTSPFEGLTLSLDYYRNNSPFLFIPKTQDAFIEEDSLTLTALYEAGDLERGKIQANFYYTWDNAREFEKEQQTQTLGYRENQDAILAGSTVTGFKRLFDDHVLALGLNWMHTEAIDMEFERRFRFDRGFFETTQRGSLLSDPEVSNDDYAVFVQDVWSIHPKLELTLGARYDRFEQFGGYFNYRAALAYTPDEHQAWKLLYGTGIRTPTFREYLKVLEGTDFVAPIPNPERIKSLELSYLYHWEHANLNVTLFQNEIDDYIHETPTPDGADEYFTNSEAPWRLRGVETLIQVQPLENLDLRLSGAYLDAESRQTGDLPYLASWSGSFNLNYQYLDNHRLGFSLIYSSQRTDTNNFQNDNPDGFLITNVFGSGRLTRNLSYAFGVDNLFDTRVFDPAADFGNQHNTERSEREIWGRIKWSFEP